MTRFGLIKEARDWLDRATSRLSISSLTNWLSDVPGISHLGRLLADDRAVNDTTSDIKSGVKSTAQGVTDAATGSMNRVMRTQAGAARWLDSHMTRGGWLHKLIRPDTFADYSESNAKAVRDYGRLAHSYWEPSKEYSANHSLARKLSYTGGGILASLPEMTAWQKFYQAYPFGNPFVKSLGGTLATLGPQISQLTGITYINPNDDAKKAATKKSVNSGIFYTGSILNPLGYLAATALQRPEVRAQRQIANFEQARNTIPALISPQELAPHATRAVSRALGNAGNFVKNHPEFAVGMGLGTVAALGETGTALSIIKPHPQVSDYAEWLYNIGKESPTLNSIIKKIRYGYRSPLLQVAGIQPFRHPVSGKPLPGAELESMWRPVINETVEQHPIRDVGGVWRQIAPFFGESEEMSPELRSALNKHKNLFGELQKDIGKTDPRELFPQYMFWNQLRRRIDRQSAKLLEDKNAKTK